MNMKIIFLKWLKLEIKIIKNEIPTKDAWDDESDSDIGRSICYGEKEIKHKSEIGSKRNKKKKKKENIPNHFYKYAFMTLITVTLK